MNCTQNIKDTLLRFTLKSDDNTNSNKIASTSTSETMSKEDLTVKIIEEMVQKGENKSFTNKIAAAVNPSSTNKGEVAELIGYLPKLISK